MRIRPIIAAIIAFIVVMLVSIYLLHFIAAAILPSSGDWVVYGIPEILGLAMAVIAAYLGWKYSDRIESLGQ